MIRRVLHRPPSPHLVFTKSTYHSYEHERTSPFTPPEDAVLSAGLAQVPKLGFTVDALAQGARDAGYRDVSINLFPAGPFALVHYHLVTQRRALASKQLEQGTSVDSKIRKLALERLHANAGIIDRWQEVRMPERTGTTFNDMFYRHLPSWLLPPMFLPLYESFRFLRMKYCFWLVTRASIHPGTPSVLL